MAIGNTLLSATAIANTNEVGKIVKTNGGIFSMESFNDALYVGMFGYGNSSNTGMVYKYNARSGSLLEVSGLSQQALGRSESVCALKQFKGYLYAATEERGRFFRSRNGANWQLVHTGKYPIACSLEVHNNTLFAATATHIAPEKGEVLYTNTGTSSTWKSATFSNDPGYLRELVSHQGVLYGFSVRNGQGLWHQSNDGKMWSSRNSSALFNSNVRVFRSKSIANQLWLGTAQYGVDNGHTGIWVKENSTVRKVFGNDSYSHITDFDIGFRANSDMPVLLASASTGFKSKPTAQGAAILMSADGGSTWKLLETFPNEEGSWAISRHQGRLYASTMHGGLPTKTGGFGRLLELTSIRAEPFTHTGFVSSIAAILLD